MARKVFNLGFNPLFSGREGTRTPDFMCVYVKATKLRGNITLCTRRIRPCQTPRLNDVIRNITKNFNIEIRQSCSVDSLRLPQVAEMESPQPQDAPGEILS
jgi:hypothetical protein